MLIDFSQCLTSVKAANAQLLKSLTYFVGHQIKVYSYVAARSVLQSYSCGFNRFVVYIWSLDRSFPDNKIKRNKETITKEFHVDLSLISLNLNDKIQNKNQEP